jgi:hypothetical protein
MLRDEPTPSQVTRRLLSWITGGLLLLVLALGGVPPQAVAADSTLADSRQVKAVFLVNFLSFAGWPPSKLAAPSSRLVIAVLGDPGFASVVEKAAAGRAVNGRSIVVQAVDTPEKAVDAHLVFIAGSQSQRLPAVLRTLSGSTVLTVGDTDGFAQDGVAINLYTFDNRVRIEVNNTAASRAGVHLSANLLRLARIVE